MCGFRLSPGRGVLGVSLGLVVRARYEGGVLKPLEPLDLEEGEEVVVVIRRRPNIDRLIGILGEASAGELEAYEEEVYTS
jgi:predicted DNA-binding antitoxin AbrB/MazE fold protein